MLTFLMMLSNYTPAHTAFTILLQAPDMRMNLLVICQCPFTEVQLGIILPSCSTDGRHKILPASIVLQFLEIDVVMVVVFEFNNGQVKFYFSAKLFQLLC